MSAGQPAPTPRRYDKLAEEGFQRNAVVFCCVNLIAECTAAVPWRLFRGRGRDRRLVESHPLLDLLARPNPLQATAAFFHGVYATRLLAGNSYIEAVGPSEGPNAGRPRELWSLRPDRMQVIKGEDGQPAGYRFRAGGRTVDWQFDPVTGSTPILHSKSFHGLRHRGRAAHLLAGAPAASRRERSRWPRRLLENPLQHPPGRRARAEVRPGSPQARAMTPVVMPYAGTAAPPKGYRGRPKAKRHGAIRLSDTDYGRLVEAQVRLESEWHYRPDVEDTWERPSWQWVKLLSGFRVWRLSGDCEDFAIEYLERVDWVPWHAKRLIQCWTEKGVGHAVAAIDSLNRGTLCVDNRRPLAYWETTRNAHRYRFEKGITQVPGRRAWAWNIRAPSLADIIRRTT